MNTVQQSIAPLKDGSKLTGIAPKLAATLRELDSVVITEKFQEIANIHSIAIVGSSGSGKTTLINALRKHSNLQGNAIDIPLRYTTRPRRKNEDGIENQHVSEEEFQKKCASKEIGISWIRPMENDRKEQYGFARSKESLLPIYSANNSLARSISKTNAHMLVVGVFAPDQTRKDRLNARSPDISQEERSYRLSDSIDKIAPFCHLIIENYGKQELTAKKDIVSLVERVIQQRVSWGTTSYLAPSKIEYQSRTFSIKNRPVLFADGKIKKFQYVERSPGVRTLITCADKILLTKEWREEVNCWDYRLPGGKLFETASEYQEFLEKSHSKEELIEKAQKSAKSEVYEETGIDLKNVRLKMSHVSHCGTSVRWDLYYFSATLNEIPNLPETVISEESECVTKKWVSFTQLQQLIHEGAIHEDRTVAFLLRYFMKQKG